jgi:hypothetical protein
VDSSPDCIVFQQGERFDATFPDLRQYAHAPRIFSAPRVGCDRACVDACRRGRLARVDAGGVSALALTTRRPAPPLLAPPLLAPRPALEWRARLPEGETVLLCDPRPRARPHGPREHTLVIVR